MRNESDFLIFRDKSPLHYEHLDEHLLKNVRHAQAIQDVDEFITSLDLENVAFHHFSPMDLLE